MNQHQPRTMSIALAAIMSAAALVACSPERDNRTAGEKLDSAVAKVEQKSAEAGAEVREAAKDAKQATAGAIDAASDKARDAAITTSVNAELAKDDSLKAMRIDVDTVDGRVALRGTAPDAGARERASMLATGVQGVKSVDNQLTVAAKS
ncbi:MAG TPA: BON domain-containing protein [Rubrivivax sp.]